MLFGSVPNQPIIFWYNIYWHIPWRTIIKVENPALSLNINQLIYLTLNFQGTKFLFCTILSFMGVIKASRTPPPPQSYHALLRCKAFIWRLLSWFIIYCDILICVCLTKVMTAQYFICIFSCVKLAEDHWYRNLHFVWSAILSGAGQTRSKQHTIYLFTGFKLFYPIRVGLS